MDDATRPRVLDYLRDHVTMTVAAIHHDQPHAVTLFYASSELDLYFVSDLKAEHSQAIVANGRVSVTISQDYADWRAIQGLQLRGLARLPEDAQEARSVYLAKFPFVADFPPTFRFWHIRTDWLRFIDNTRGFAHKDELTISPTC